MFIYFVAPVATLLIIFGLTHVKRLNDWLRSSLRCSRTLYNGLVCRPHQIQLALIDEDLGILSVPERPATLISDRVEFEDVSPQRITFDTAERSSDAHLLESQARNLNPRYSFENILSLEREKDLGLQPTRLHFGTTQNDAIRTARQEGKEDALNALKSIEKTAHPPSRLNTRQIYNLILKETMKECEARQKLLDSEKRKNESPQVEITEQSSSENKVEREEVIK